MLLNVALNPNLALDFFAFIFRPLNVIIEFFPEMIQG